MPGGARRLRAVEIALRIVTALAVSTPDPRVTPARPDLAARHLEGTVTAARFVDGEILEVVDAQAPLRRAPAGDAPLETEALMGERVSVYETTEEGWAWGQLEADGYVGYLPANALAVATTTPTHKVSALRTLIFPGPSIKLPPIAAPSLGARSANGCCAGYCPNTGCYRTILTNSPPSGIPIPGNFGGRHYLRN